MVSPAREGRVGHEPKQIMWARPQGGRLGIVTQPRHHHAILRASWALSCSW
jgi:hypothetical protein